MTTSAVDVATGREVSSRVVATIFSYVDRVLGADGVRRVLDRAGFDGVTLAEMQDTSRWFTVAETARLHDAAASVCGDEGIGRRCGEELFRTVVDIGLSDALAATGSVPAACQAVAEYGSRMSQDRPLWIADAGDDYVLIQSRAIHPGGDHRFFCGITAGYYANMPALFGSAGVVAEEECQVAGASQCTFRLTWRAMRPLTPPAPSSSEDASDLFHGTVERFEQLQNTAKELVGAEDVDDVLERITHNVSAALDAPRYLLTAKLHDRDRLRVHTVGFAADAAAVTAAEVMAGETSEEQGALVVEVESTRRTFGRLAAFFGPGAVLKPSDRRLLEAYAGHAAAALEVIASLEEARKDRDTARALLDLASALAQVGTVDEIAERLSAAVPAVVDCDVANTWLFDRATGGVVLKGSSDRVGCQSFPAIREYDMQTLPELTDMIERPRPVLLVESDAPAGMRSMFDELGVEQLAIVPITSKGTFLGVAIAGFRAAVTPDGASEVIKRLSGLADHAATALENAELLEQARHEAGHDRLTGLPNRPLVEDRGRKAFEAAARTGRGVGLLFVDLDRFKIINDTLGHSAGDELICQVATRMQAHMRSSDTLARLGGDEFVVLLPDLEDISDAVAVAERLIGALKGAFHVAGQELFVSCSVGIACSPEHGSDYEELLQYGDTAMYAAKAAGRGAFAVHASSGNQPSRDRLELESQLHSAIDNGELRVHYQPQVDVATMRIVGVEALVRWEHPELGLLAPGAFLSLAEESGLILAIDEWMRREAFAQAKEWVDLGHPLRVSVNLSTRALANPNLADLIRREIAEAGVAPHLIELEVTDRVVMSDQELPAVLESLKALGVRLAIDDFGTGTSVLTRLQTCRVDTLKIDRSFVKAITEDSPDSPLIKALIALAHSLKLQVVGEGVETLLQDDALRRYGCELIQGFLFSRPVPAAEIGQLLAGMGRDEMTAAEVSFS